MANEIDLLMDLDPLEMSAKDIDAIIAYHRNNRAKEGPDGKMVKAKGATPKAKVDLASLIKGMTGGDGEAPKSAGTKTGGLRRV